MENYSSDDTASDISCDYLYGAENTDNNLQCQTCSRNFIRKFNYEQHLQRGCTQYDLKCQLCNKVFASKYTLQRHRRVYHSAGEQTMSFQCGICKESLCSLEMLQEHRRREHVRHNDFRLRKTAHNRAVQILCAHFPDAIRTMDEALFHIYKQMKKLVRSILVRAKYFKMTFTLFVEMYRLGEFGEIAQMDTFPFRSFGTHFARVCVEGDIEEKLQKVCGDFERNVDEFLFQGSGWVVHKPLYIDAEFSECRPLAGAGCGLHLATYLRGTGVGNTTVINDENEECFYFAVAASFLGTNANVSELKDFIQQNLVKLSKEGPVAVKDITAFEQLNSKHDLAINVVFKDEKGAMLPVRASRKLREDAHEVILLLFHTVCSLNGERVSSMHYSYVSCPEKLLALRVEDPRTRKVRTNDVSICWNCFTTFSKKCTYLTHAKYCHLNGEQRVKFPFAGQVKCFESVHKANSKLFRSAFMLFFDFEALQVEVENTCSCSKQVMENTWIMENTPDELLQEYDLENVMLEGEVTARWEGKKFDAEAKGKEAPKPPKKLSQGRPSKICPHKTSIVREQPPFAYSYIMLDREGVVREEKTYVGEDAAENFVISVLNLADKWLPTLTPGEDMEELTREERKKLYREKKCYICEQLMAPAERVLDHDHLTGEFLGVAHSACNLLRREKTILTCFAHNFSGYDSHFIIRALSEQTERIKKLVAIPINTQKFKAIYINGRIGFLDSMGFLPGSLSSLVDNLVASNSSFDILEQLLPDDAVKKRLLLRKGVFPYEFATSIKALKKKKHLPEIYHFDSSLSGEGCSQEDYAHAWEVWRAFDCKNMLDYTVLYVKSDVYLLAEVMYDLRQMVWNSFGLDMCQYVSMPQLAFDMMLKSTGAKIELIYEPEMAYFLKRSIRGGHSYVNTRHLTRTDGNILLFLDVNALYSYAMTLKLPIGDYEWMDSDELDGFDPMLCDSDADEGYILEVDLSYPARLHESHSSFPLAPDNMDIEWEDLSDYSKECAEVLTNKSRHSSRKLTANFREKKGYVIHAQNLKLYLKLGMKLHKIRRGIKFRQEAYIRPYIENCVQRRQAALTESEAAFYKLICNIIYGKVLESSDKKMDCTLVRSRERSMRLASHPLHQGTTIFGEDLSINFSKKKHCTMEQAWAVGFSVLDLSKHFMYELFYERIQPALGVGNVSVVLSDTDSFLLAVRENGDEGEVLQKLESIMDFSNLDKEDALYSVARKKIPGYLKSEVPKSKIMEVTALKSKTYALSTLDTLAEEAQDYADTSSHAGPYRGRASEQETSTGKKRKIIVKAKGVKSAVKDKIPMGDFRACIEEIRAKEVMQHSIRSKDHVNQLIESKKIAFSSFDDKRYLLCPVHSVPYGSKFIAWSKKRNKCYSCHAYETSKHLV